MTSTGPTPPPIESFKPRKATPALMPLIEGLESRIRHHFSISDAHYDLRRPIHRTHRFRFLDLPGEVREKIYKCVWGTGMGYYFWMRLCYPSVSIRRHHDRGLRFYRGIALLLVSKQVSREAAYVLYSQTALQIDAVPYGTSMNLHSVSSARMRWFISTTRCILVRSSFSFDTERNKKWVNGLRCFEALSSVEVLLDLDMGVDEFRLKDVMICLLPFATLECETITFRGPPHIQESSKRAAEAAWQEALGIERTEPIAMVKLKWDYLHKMARTALEAQEAQAAQAA